MSEQPDDLSQLPQEQAIAPSSAAPQWVRMLIPFVVTVCVSVVLSLLLQSWLFPQQSEPLTPIAAATSAPTQTSTAVPSPTAAPLPTLLPSPEPAVAEATGSTDTPVSTQPLTDTEVGQQIAVLQHELNRLWSAFYLSRAANQIADAEAALRINDLTEVEQTLATIDTSLDRAYDRSPEQEKGPISEFQMEIGRIHADLRVRPEGVDQQLQRLRRSMLSLIDETG